MDSHYQDETVLSLSRRFRCQNISLKFVPRGPIDSYPWLVQLMAWRRTGDKTLSESMMTQFTDAYMRHQGDLSWSLICMPYFLLSLSCYIVRVQGSSTVPLCKTYWEMHTNPHLKSSRSTRSSLDIYKWFLWSADIRTRATLKCSLNCHVLFMYFNTVHQANRRITKAHFLTMLLTALVRTNSV